MYSQVILLEVDLKLLLWWKKKCYIKHLKVLLKRALKTQSTSSFMCFFQIFVRLNILTIFEQNQVPILFFRLQKIKFRLKGGIPRRSRHTTSLFENLQKGLSPFYWVFTVCPLRGIASNLNISLGLAKKKWSYQLNQPSLASTQNSTYKKTKVYLSSRPHIFMISFLSIY